MVTDRSTTAGLTMYLGHIYPRYMVAFQFLVGLDLSSHYMHMYRYARGDEWKVRQFLFFFQNPC